MSEVPQNAFIVTSGTYADCAIRGVFWDESSAQRYAGVLRDSRERDVEVCDFPARGAGFIVGRNLSLMTILCASTGDVVETYERTHVRDAADADGQLQTIAPPFYMNHGRPVTYQVLTIADVRLSDQARAQHEDRVSTVQREVRG
ncbi:hypothetical protein [Streptomyces sp. NPDC020141]|uniref:hypothetical protein n=1 Tax=Streptomyces sp. NPDC020141 TaxID=3365065 RepID=UPI00378F4119